MSRGFGARAGVQAAAWSAPAGGGVVSSAAEFSGVKPGIVTGFCQGVSDMVKGRMDKGAAS